ncbi:hypothetical protein B0H19DRAFT_1245809 [Mycena capillaripes]|nr:hypothetical protein B0H19DRAFT_1245809 [Mycena capillaripes]
MHPSLLLSNFSALPGHRKTIAVAAAKGSLKHLATLSQVIVTPNVPRDEIVALLPALYSNLDPAPIPDPQALDDIISTGVRVPYIEGAGISLNALASICQMGLFPVDAAPDMWPRVWPWSNFLHTYWDYLPGLPPKTLRGEALTSDAYIVMTLADHQPTARKIYATSGVRSLLVQAWSILLNQRSSVPEVERVAYQDAGRILNVLTFDSDYVRNNDEILDAIGGTIDDFAAAVVAHLGRGTVLPKSDITVACQGSSITFCKERDIDEGPLRACLLSHGIVTRLVEAIIAFDGAVIPGVGDEIMGPTVRYTFDELLKYLRTPPGYPWIMEALKAGLLGVVIAFYASAPPDRTNPCTVYPHLMDLLCVIIPGALVYCGVVTQIKQSIKEVILTQGFKRSPLFEIWNSLAALIEKRVGVFDNWNGGVSSRACDNIKTLHLFDALKHPDILTQRERSFMRAVLTRNFEEVIYHASYLQVQYLQKHPGTQFYTHFDYAQPFNVPITVHSAAALAEMQLPELQVELPTRLARAANSGGRLELHFVYVPEGHALRLRLLPLRSSSMAFHDGLLRIASVVGDADFSEVFPYVQHLVSGLISERARNGVVMH